MKDHFNKMKSMRPKKVHVEKFNLKEQRDVYIDLLNDPDIIVIDEHYMYEYNSLGIRQMTTVFNNVVYVKYFRISNQ